MGRGRGFVRVGQRYYREEKIKPDEIKTGGQLFEVMNDLESPTGNEIRQQRLVVKDEKGKYRVNPAAIRQGVKEIRKSIVDHRQQPKEYTMQLAAEQGAREGSTAKRELNATDREYAAKAQAIEAVARVGKVQLTPDEKRTLSQAKKGFFKAVYGSKGQYEQGTLSTKTTGRSARSSSDPAAKARARENAERLAEYRGRNQRSSGQSSVNPFSRPRNYEQRGISPTTRPQPGA